MTLTQWPLLLYIWVLFANLTTLLVTHHEELDHTDENVEEVELEAGTSLVICL